MPRDTGSRLPQRGAREGTQAKPAATRRPASKAGFCIRALQALCRQTGKPFDADHVRGLLPSAGKNVTGEAFARAAEALGYRAVAKRAAPARLHPPFLRVDAKGAAKSLLLARHGKDFLLFDLVRGTERREPVQALRKAEDVLLLRPRRRGALPDRAGGLRPFFGKRFRGVFFEILLASFMINLFALATPLFVMTVYNKVIAHAALDTLHVLVLGMATLYVFDMVLRGIRGYVVSHTGGRIDAILGSETMRRLLNLPYRALEAAPAGALNERLRQIDTLREFFAGAVPVLLVDQLFVLPFLLVLFLLSPLLGTIALIALPMFALVSFALYRIQRGFYADRFQALSERTSTYLETLQNALTVKSLGLEPEITRRWEARVAKAAAIGFQAGNLTAMANAAAALLQQGVSLAIVFLGAKLVIGGDLSIGALVAANLLAMRAIAPMRQTVLAWNQLQETRHALRELEAFFEPGPQEAPGADAPFSPAGAIRLENVSFRYAPDTSPVLDRVQLEVPKESILAVVGPAGSGKSTLAKLLLGLYAPSEGRVLFDETDLAHLPPAALHRNVASVPQENQLFSGTVQENLLFGLRDVPAERAIAAAKFVGAHAFIQRLPKGYETPIGEGGQNLSAGQKQMLCIARTLVRNPKILLLDEATNAIDPAAEEALLRKLRQKAKGHTLLLLTNRLAPASIADRIALLVDGRIERVGTRAEMIDFARARLAELAEKRAPG